VNEIQLLKAHLASEREHLRALAARSAAAAGPSGPLARPDSDLSVEYITSYISYLMFIIRKERARAEAHAERFGGAKSQGPMEHAALERLQEALASVATIEVSLRAALAARGAPEARERARELVDAVAVVEALIDARVALEALASSRYTVDDWRHTAQIDADSILEERRLRAQVLQHHGRAAC